MAKTIATYYALFFHKKSNLIRHGTRERFELTRRFAEIGMKGAISSSTFDKLDANKDGQLDVKDLVCTYARIDGVEFDQAFAVAHLVMEEADKDAAKGRSFFGSTKKVAPSKHGASYVDFSEFLVAREGGGMIPWSEYLNIAVEQAHSDPRVVDLMAISDKEECQRLFDQVKGEKESQRSCSEHLEVWSRRSKRRGQKNGSPGAASPGAPSSPSKPPRLAAAASSPSLPKLAPLKSSKSASRLAKPRLGARGAARYTAQPPL